MSIVDIVFAFLLIVVGVVTVAALVESDDREREVLTVGFSIAAITLGAGFWLLHLAAVSQ